MISIVIPAYNEEKRLPPTLEKIQAYLAAKNMENEIILVVDKSKDGTVEFAENYAKEHENVRTLVNPEKKGKGYAIRRGMVASKGDLVLFSDADLSTPIEEVEKFLPRMNEYDIVIGSRALSDSQVEKKLLSRVILGNLGNLLIQIVLFRGIKDTQCGFKLFKGEAARKIFSVAQINGFGFDFESLFLAKKYGYKVYECPVAWTHMEDTKVTWQSHFTTLTELFRIKLNDIKGVYKDDSKNIQEAVQDKS